MSIGLLWLLLTQKPTHRCNENKDCEKFIKKRNICKDCRNIKSKELYKSIQVDPNSNQECNTCHETKPLTEIVKNRTICKSCNNSNRRNKYSSKPIWKGNKIKLINSNRKKFSGLKFQAIFELSP